MIEYLVVTSAIFFVIWTFQIQLQGFVLKPSVVGETPVGIDGKLSVGIPLTNGKMFDFIRNVGEQLKGTGETVPANLFQ